MVTVPLNVHTGSAWAGIAERQTKEHIAKKENSLRENFMGAPRLCVQVYRHLVTADGGRFGERIHNSLVHFGQITYRHVNSGGPATKAAGNCQTVGNVPRAGFNPLPPVAEIRVPFEGVF